MRLCSVYAPSDVRLDCEISLSRQSVMIWVILTHVVRSKDSQN